ncbi:probable DNA metabolism protein [Anaerovirgula multivorans]|uniref:Probable DNA metabolism protein n=1 Tax=Anaerovirgula multivorans TaxID=312168 RepID=A0A239G2J5_9FIRM|nr:TIGR03915 family putative DNA repair protein [Anaerovirgula multivorans]SNS63389.1 probable DNA metabolism protein [Anaerovirgula multivorans]
MYYYIYDGSFEGMLTAVYEAYYRPERPEKILRQNSIQENIFVSSILIHTDEEKAGKVYHAIKEKISSMALRNVFYAFLSEEENAATKVYQYLRLGWRVGKRIDDYHAEDRVLALHQLSQKVSRETHGMLGLLRFQKIEGDIYYAEIEPDHNITALLAPHFARRMADQNWIIHDVKRDIAALYNKERWIMTEGQLQEEIALDEEEIQYQDLWRKYFKTIAIKSRKNPRLQKAFMPKRYWKHLVELKGK